MKNFDTVEDIGKFYSDMTNISFRTKLQDNYLKYIKMLPKNTKSTIDLRDDYWFIPSTDLKYHLKYKLNHQFSVIEKIELMSYTNIDLRDQISYLEHMISDANIPRDNQIITSMIFSLMLNFVQFAEKGPGEIYSIVCDIDRSGDAKNLPSMVFDSFESVMKYIKTVLCKINSDESHSCAYYIYKQSLETTSHMGSLLGIMEFDRNHNIMLATNHGTPYPFSFDLYHNRFNDLLFNDIIIPHDFHNGQIVQNAIDSEKIYIINNIDFKNIHGCPSVQIFTLGDDDTLTLTEIPIIFLDYFKGYINDDRVQELLKKYYSFDSVHNSEDVEG